MNKEVYIVYGVNDEVLYVGKGASGRSTHATSGVSHNRELNKYLIEKGKDNMFVKILHNNLRDFDATYIEKLLIQKLQPKFNKTLKENTYLKHNLFNGSVYKDKLREEVSIQYSQFKTVSDKVMNLVKNKLPHDYEFIMKYGFDLYESLPDKCYCRSLLLSNLRINIHLQNVECFHKELGIKVHDILPDNFLSEGVLSYFEKWYIPFKFYHVDRIVKSSFVIDNSTGVNIVLKRKFDCTESAKDFMKSPDLISVMQE
ncbi:hypothetical protein Phab24_id071 [Acinetobacter phage Phab24]|nr:hypothetical protein Phab24_id071 [Acinetobacter phage Phab24]